MTSAKITSPLGGPKRTLRHELQIVSEAIELLKGDVAKAEANRLTAGRISNDRYEAWKPLELEVVAKEGEAEEGLLMKEFLFEDIQTLRGKIEAQKWSCRLAAQSEDRIGKMEEVLQEKKIVLAAVLERVEELKMKLEEFRALKNKDWKRGCNDGGAGDISENGDLENYPELQKITSHYEDECQERESLEEDIKFISSRLVDLRQKQARVASELKLWQAELDLKERQLHEAESRTEDLVRIKHAKVEECQRKKIAYEKAAQELNQIDEAVRTLKQLMRNKIAERNKLEGKVERLRKVEDWRRFSDKVNHSLPVSIAAHYPDVTDPLVVKYLQSIVKGLPPTTESSPFWTDELENLKITFKERGSDENATENGNYQKVLPLPPLEEPSALRTYQSPLIPLPTTLKKLRKVGSCHYGLKFSDALAYGVNTYPKTVVANGVIRDRKGEPEKLFGPLPHDLWRRHDLNTRRFSANPRFASCPRFLRPIRSATTLLRGDKPSGASPST